ncbi:MAG: translocation/assembly module TamB domain-containing protein [Mangrovicoccus sp.]|nr:translocation/assembly module TamB domain-containing protein [Mangrovicoccus sp.]
MIYSRSSLFAAVSALALIAAAPLGHAQTSAEDDPGFLERMIQNALGGDGRDVQIRGLEGPLSGEPRIAEITVSDGDGQWLAIRDVALNWSRLALFRGRVEINTLSVGEIALDRTPLPAPDEPRSLEAKKNEPKADAETENTGFALPELPVSLRLDEMAIGAIRLGQPILGLAADLSLEGNARLEGGEGAVDLRLVRLEGPEGVFDLSAGFENETRQLRTALDFREAEGGLITSLANIPGAPPLELTIAGDDPISDFTAQIALRSDEAERLAGTIRLSETPLPASEGNDTDLVQQNFNAELAGDVTALFAPDYQAFFGDHVALDLRGNRKADLGLNIEQLRLSAAALQMDGKLAFASDFAPQMVDISATLAQPLGLPVVLPLPGPAMMVSHGAFDLDFDAAEGERFTLNLSAENVARETVFMLDELALKGDGRLTLGSETPVEAISAAITGELTGLFLDDPSLSEAAGDEAQLQAQLDWNASGQLQLSDLRLAADELALTGAAQAVGLNTEAPELTLNADLDSGPLSRFAALAGTDLRGELTATLKADFEPDSGAFSLTLDGDGQDLALGRYYADQLLQGPLDLALSASRGGDGITIDRLALNNDNLELNGGGRLASRQGDLELQGNIADLGIFQIQDLDGPARLSFSLEGQEDLWDALFDLHSQTSRINGSAQIENLFGDEISLNAAADIETGDLSLYAPLAGIPLSGDLNLNALASYDAASKDIGLLAEGTSHDLRIGQEQLDAALSGETALEIRAQRVADRLTIERLDVHNPALDLNAQGYIEGDGGDLRLLAKMDDIGALRIENLTGPVDLNAKLIGEADEWVADLDLVSDDTHLAGDAEITDLIAGAADATGTVTLRADNLSRYADLAGLPLTGALKLDATGGYNVDSGDGALRATGGGTGLSTGIAELDAVLAGAISLNIDADRKDGDIDVSRAELRSEQLTLSANGDMSGGAGQFDLSLDLANLGRVIEGVNGPLALRSTLEGSGDNWDVNGSLTGPSGMNAAITGGAIRPDGAVDLAITGGLPLLLADPFISPTVLIGDLNFDLAMQGAPGLEALSGTVTTQNARASDPGSKLVLQDINLNLGIANQSAQLALTSALATGGTISVNGPVALTPPFNANINAALDAITLLDPTLYEVNLNGNATLQGALAENAAITAGIVIDRADIKIPTGLGGPGAIPDVEHLGETGLSRATRKRAGINIDPPAEEETPASRGPDYPLNITIAAPRQIFVRGRGLDVEMGGNIRVGGSSSNPIPTGGIKLRRGQFALLGQRLEFDRAEINMQGDLVPDLNIAAYSDSGSVRSQILIEGPVTAPEISFASEPELPEDEVLAQLFFGKPVNELTPLELAQLLGSVNRLAGGGGGLLGGLRSGIGLDSLGINTDEEGGTEVSAGRYISEKLYTDVTVGADGTSEIELNYDVNSTLKGRVGFNSEGNSSIGFAFERDY